MRKIFPAVFLCLFATTAHSESNIMFGENDTNSVAIHIAPGTGSGSLLHLIYPGEWEFVPMTMIMANYAQPMTIFRMPARVSANIMQNFAYNSTRGLSFFGVGLSWDIAPFNWHGFYIGAGLGPYYRNNYDRWVSSRLVFGEKFFIGRVINEHIRAELFTIHFSNGDFTETNLGFNFAGLSLHYSF
ncbi:MAG: acyloxyacyl hydrolase [Alphaproteobacteria bacterium]|nr:acyloxyacyl hydrolase [Alphaproteobacteria bacterium]